MRRGSVSALAISVLLCLALAGPATAGRRPTSRPVRLRDHIDRVLARGVWFCPNGASCPAPFLPPDPRPRLKIRADMKVRIKLHVPGRIAEAGLYRPDRDGDVAVLIRDVHVRNLNARRTHKQAQLPRHLRKANQLDLQVSYPSAGAFYQAGLRKLRSG